MKKLVKHVLALFGLRMERNKPFLHQLDPAFNALYDSIREYTRVKPDRMFFIYQFARYAKRLDGNGAILGVYKGGSAKVIAEALQKKLYVFDTFEGLPDGSGRMADTSEEKVSELLKEYNVSIHKGFFPDTTKGVNDKFCFVYLDPDLGKSVEDGLTFFWPRLASGGIVLIDDDYSTNWPGVEEALDAFSKKERIDRIRTTKHQSLLIKG